MDETLLARIAAEMNAAPAVAASVSSQARLVAEMNRIVRETADALVDLDSTTASFEALKNAAERPA